MAGAQVFQQVYHCFLQIEVHRNHLVFPSTILALELFSHGRYPQQRYLVLLLLVYKFVVGQQVNFREV